MVSKKRRPNIKTEGIWERPAMSQVFQIIDCAYVCSKFGGTEGERKFNKQRALIYCAFVAKIGYSPYAPHVINPDFLPLLGDDGSGEGNRELGMQIGLNYLTKCKRFFAFFEDDKELWTSGMTRERMLAEAINIPVTRVFQAQYLWSNINSELVVVV
jgi:hypothetical protein